MLVTVFANASAALGYPCSLPFDATAGSFSIMSHSCNVVLLQCRFHLQMDYHISIGKHPDKKSSPSLVASMPQSIAVIDLKLQTTLCD